MSALRTFAGVIPVCTKQKNCADRREWSAAESAECLDGQHNPAAALTNSFQGERGPQVAWLLPARKLAASICPSFSSGSTGLMGHAAAVAPIKLMHVGDVFAGSKGGVNTLEEIAELNG